MRHLLLAAVLALVAGPAAAACYEDIGCTDADTFSRSDLRRLSCNALWEVRNQIYFDAGYCFKTDRALDFFGDDECEYDDAGDLSLNRYERSNISTIAAVEKQKHC